MKATFVLAIIVAASLIGCSSVSDESPSSNEPVTAAQIAKSYLGFELMTPDPTASSQQMSTLCVVPIFKDRGTQGPHKNHTLKIFANAAAKKSIEGKSYPFPVGSVIVKEKLKDGNTNGVGRMIKRDAGYNPDNGDWEYFYYEEITTMESGKIATCVDCHSQKTDTDRVFATWR